MTKLLSILCISLLSFSAQAQTPEKISSFVESNILGIFYHELGHALINIEGIPIFAQEEDAADVFSIYMIDSLFDEESAVSLAYDAAFGFIGEVEAREAMSDEIAWWGIHGPAGVFVESFLTVFAMEQ